RRAPAAGALPLGPGRAVPVAAVRGHGLGAAAHLHRHRRSGAAAALPGRLGGRPLAVRAVVLAPQPRAHGLDGGLSVSTLGRVLRLWRVQAHLDLLFLTQDARRAGTYLASDTIITVATFAATLLVAERFGGIGEWSKQQVAFMLGFGLTVHGL